MLETCFETAAGRVRITDAMPVGSSSHIVRCVEGLSGKVDMRMRCAPRPDYGKHKPQVRETPEDLPGRAASRAVFLSDGQCLALSSDLEHLQVTEHEVAAEFTLEEGQKHWFILSCSCEEDDLPGTPDPWQALQECQQWWREWISKCQYRGRWEGAVRRSLITLKALIYAPSGAMVAAPTTSLPEVPGGSSNWDYRFCWIRDAAFALKVLLNAGYKEEVIAWRDWLEEAVAQQEQHLHALYTVDAKVAPEERELDWLPGYLDSRPVRANNAASDQYQLDLRGELVELLHLARQNGLQWKDEMWKIQCEMLEELEGQWRKPDPGIWEFRTMCEQMTHSKILSWVAYDLSIKDAREYGLPAPVEHWCKIRDEIRHDVLERGVDPEGGHFTQRYGAPDVDASLLLIPLVGFLPATDPRMKATVARIEQELCEEGLVRRYRTGDQANEEGMFIVCCFWLADNYWLAGRREEAEALFTRVLGLCNDVGLLAEEYDLRTRQLLGNFPQGLSHLGLISTARLIALDSDADISLT